MPQKDEHVNWAIHDRDFWTSIDLDNSSFTDWAVTGMFYEAVHWVEAFLDTKGCGSRTHSTRDLNMLKWASAFGVIQADYTTLKQDSQKGRYDCHKHTANEIKQLIPLVDNIKGHISQLL